MGRQWERGLKGENVLARVHNLTGRMRYRASSAREAIEAGSYLP